MKKYSALKIFLIILIVFTQSGLLFPQRAHNDKPESSGNRYKYDHYQTSNSTLSDPSEISFDTGKKNYDRRDKQNKNEKYIPPHENRNRDYNDSTGKTAIMINQKIIFILTDPEELYGTESTGIWMSSRCRFM